MARTTSRRAIGHGGIIGAFATALRLGLGSIASPAIGQEVPTYEVWDFGVVPRPSVIEVLLDMEPVQQELKMTDAQKKEQNAISGAAAGVRRRCSRRGARSRTAPSSRPPATPSSRSSRRRSGRSSSRSSGSAWTRSSSRPRGRSPSPGATAGRWTRYLPARRWPSGSSCPTTRAETDPDDRPGGRRGDHQGGQLPDRPGFQGRAAEHGGHPQAGRQPGIPGGQAEGPPGGPRRGRRGDPTHRGGPDRAAARGLSEGCSASRSTCPGSAEGRGAGSSDERHQRGDPGLVGGGGGQRADPDFNTKVARPAYAGGPGTRASSSTRPTTTSTPPTAATSRSPT